MDYKPPRPLEILISPNILSKYQRMFTFILRLLRGMCLFVIEPQTFNSFVSPFSSGERSQVPLPNDNSPCSRNLPLSNPDAVAEATTPLPLHRPILRIQPLRIRIRHSHRREF